MKYIDLSLPINNQTFIFPGDPQIKIAQAGILAKDGFSDHSIFLSNHAGTHIDVPSHMVEGGKNLDQFSIEKFIGRGVYIKVGDKFDFSEIKKVDIREGDIAIFHTGMAEKYNKQDYLKSYPVMSQEIADYLVSKGIKMVGLDTCSADNERSFPIHKTFLKSEVLIIENVTNVAQLKGKQFKIYALPLKLEVDGAPARVIAEVV